MSCTSKSQSVTVAIILLELATVSYCVTTTTTSNSSTPFFPRVGRDYPAGHTDYNNAYNNYLENNNVYNNLGSSVNNAYNTLEHSVHNNAYTNIGSSVNSNAANNAYYGNYEQDNQRNTAQYTPRKGYGYHYQPYPGHISQYQPFYQGPPPNCLNENSMVDSLLNIGATKLGGLGLLAHIPFVLKLLLKFVLVKLGFFMFGAPLLLPLILPVLGLYLPYLANKFRPCCGGGYGDDGDDDGDGYNNNNRTTRVRFQEGGGYERAIGRAVKTLMDAERCYEKMACHLGTANAQSEYNKPIMWILASMVKAGTQKERDRLTSFKEAYTKGVQDKTCGNEIYQCHLGKLMEGFK